VSQQLGSHFHHSSGTQFFSILTLVSACNNRRQGLPVRIQLEKDANRNADRMRRST
jgi:hypothetical protein